MKQFKFPGVCAGIGLLGLLASATANASTMDSASVCQDGLNYGWDAVYGAGYRICPVQTDNGIYSSYDGYMYLNNPNGANVSGYLNVILWDGTWSSWCSMSTNGRTMGCNVGVSGRFVFVTYDHDMPADVSVYGFYTTANL